MKVTYQWLKDFVDIRLSPEALADKLTMAGLEVTSLEKKNDDVVFEIEVTSNRADWLSVVGVAREVAAITRSKFKAQSSKFRVRNKNEPAPLKIIIENKKDCPLYAAKIIRNVKGGPSPDWLKKRLELVGCRSINNIVDITNYVLFTWGEPLHAFDLDKVIGQLAGWPVGQLNVIIRRAKKEEEIITIDGIKRILDEEILVIASETKEATGKPANRQTGKPIAIAGIMGGRDTEVTEDTKDILLEAAVFDPIIVRHGRQALGLQTDSSYRFERGMDRVTAEFASWQAVHLIQELTKGLCTTVKSSGGSLGEPKTLRLNLSTVRKILNIDITGATIKNILSRLGFKIKAKGKNNFSVKVPSHRADVSLEMDLIEEIARIFGFERIPKSLPLVRPEPQTGGERDKVSLTKNILAGLGLNEVITYGLIDRDLLNNLGFTREGQTVEILNPLSKEQEILRPTLLASLTQCVAYNLNQKQEHVGIFEVAQVFLDDNNRVREELRLGVALCGSRSLLLEQGLIKDPAGLLHLKGILEVFFERVGVEEYDLSDSHPAPFTKDILVRKEKVGLMTMLDKNALDKFDIKNKNVFLLELSLQRCFPEAARQKKFIPPPKYPGIVRDISLVLKDSVSAKEVLAVLKKQGEPLLKDIKIVDYYKGKQIPAGHNGLTLSCLYRSDEKTLTEEEINPVHLLLCRILAERFAARIR
jgi:phenylalanyl-tRNA synthetase beta chain